MEEEIDFLKCISYERWLFDYWGMYDLQNGESISKKIKRFMVFFFTWLIIVAMVIQLVIGMETLEEFTEILYFLLTQVSFVSKLSYLVYGPGNLRAFEDHLRKPLFWKYYNLFARDDLDSLMKHGASLGRAYRWLVGIILALLAISPLVDANKELPVNCYTFVDISQPINKWIVYAIQEYCINISGILNGNYDIFSAYIISFGVLQLRLIKTCFRNINYSRDENPIGIYEEKTYLSPKSLRDLYEFHIYIIDYFAMVESLLSYGVFMQFIDSMAVVCMTGCQIMVTPVMSSQFLCLVLYFTCMICQLSIFCWFGNEVLFESDSLGESCYMSNWYEGTLPEKKSLFLIMERSKRQLTLTAGNFFTLSLPTLVLILKTSYSYFAVMQRLDEEN